MVEVSFYEEHIKPLLGKFLETDEGRYLPVEVLTNGAGHYIGRMFQHGDGMLEPGSRESRYFDSEEGAEAALAKGFEWRAADENVWIYTKGVQE